MSQVNRTNVSAGEIIRNAENEERLKQKLAEKNEMKTPPSGPEMTQAIKRAQHAINSQIVKNPRANLSAEQKEVQTTPSKEVEGDVSRIQATLADQENKLNQRVRELGIRNLPSQS